MTAVETLVPGASVSVVLAARALAARNGSKEPALVGVELPPFVLDQLHAGVISSLRRHAVVSWERPGENLRLFGIGEALRLRGDRGEGLDDAMPRLRLLAASARSEVVGDARPRFFGGCRFEPGGDVHDPAWDLFGGWQFVLPRFLIAVRDGCVSGSLALLLDGTETVASLASQIQGDLAAAIREPCPGAKVHPLHRGEGLDDAGWQAAVATAVSEIRAGSYEKVVLARQLHLIGHRPINVPGVLGRLASRYPNCYVFSFVAGASTWLGASPELLVSLEDGVVSAASLAGSRPRGADEEADRRLAAELLASEKERAEHGFVVSAIREALAPVCSNLIAADTPVLMRMQNIQHLHTPVTARVNAGVDILDLVARVHPTPAVGSWPRDLAFATIEGLERMDRGWYAAPIGWLDFAGEGEFAVALRTARVAGDEATLFAGAGIVEGSVPAEEFAETELKFRPLREALTGA